ncbi:dynamin family protein [Nakamurella aerolata]|uniref:Dynamin n=1 Tax=Nakamurella aerolata TaxID=1656892 RepID=A0A849AC50_9ACTN|nr:dynamin family protein [Nakamurella aerolata]NNG36731.1 dynamin [Nakamurella aerolata]
MAVTTALPQAIRHWRESAVEWVRTGDDPDAAQTAAVLAERRKVAVSPEVVVVGETNRGKSSLVNALLGVPGLSPVDAGVATCTYLRLSYGEQPTCVAHFGGGMADITFPPAELGRWATMAAGLPGDNDLPAPRWISASMSNELLRSVTLVDTPGVGGLAPGHADLAREAAARATALLFTVDASAPFTRGELDFLASVADRVDTVHFVLTKTDVFRGWREIMAADQQLLAQYVPRFADAAFHPVSNILAGAADAQPDPRIAETIRAQSGIGELRRVLGEDVAARASLLTDANLIRRAVTVISGEIVSLEASRRALTAGAAQARELAQRREELQSQRRAGGRSWQVMLRAEIQRARVDLTHETAREVREAGTLFRGAIDAADGEQLKQLPLHIEAYAQAMCSRAHDRLLDSMGRIVHTVLSQLFTQDELSQLAAALATRPYQPLVARGPERTKSADETMMALAGGGIGLTLGSLVRMAAAPLAATAFGVVLLPVSLALGGAAAFFMVRSRRRVQDRMHLKSWLMEVLGEAKAQIDQNVAEQFIEADAQLTLALDDALAKQVALVEAELKEVDSALRLDTSERNGRLRTLDKRVAEATGLLADGEALLTRIRGTRPASSVMLPGGLTAASATRQATPAAPAASSAPEPPQPQPPQPQQPQPPQSQPPQPQSAAPTQPGPQPDPTTTQVRPVLPPLEPVAAPPAPPGRVPPAPVFRPARTEHRNGRHAAESPGAPAIPPPAALAELAEQPRRQRRDGAEADNGHRSVDDTVPPPVE